MRCLPSARLTGERNAPNARGVPEGSKKLVFPGKRRFATRFRVHFDLPGGCVRQCTKFQSLEKISIRLVRVGRSAGFEGQVLFIPQLALR